MKSELQKRHTCTDLGELCSYFGLQIIRDSAQRTITLTQSHMVHQVLQRFDFRYSSPQSTPLPTGHLLSPPTSDESVERSGPYPELVGCFIHRPEHWEAATRVLRYLCSTSGMGLVLGGRGPVVLTRHADASWLYLLSDSRDSVLLFDHTSGAAPAPPATADSATRSQWLIPQALYDVVVACYSSPTTAALGRLLLPYLFLELSDFDTVEDLVSNLRTNDARYRVAALAEDHFLSLDPTVLTVDLLKQHLLAAETSVIVGAARGTPRTPFFEGYSPSPLAPSYASAAAIDVLGDEEVGAAFASAKRRSSKGKGGRGGGGGSGSGGGGSSGGGGGSRGGGSGGGGGGSGGFGGGSGGSGSGGSKAGATQRGGPGGGQRQQQQRRSKTQSPQQLLEWFSQCGASGGSGSCPYVICMGDRAGQTSGKPHTQHRCFSRLDDAWRAEFGDEAERPRWTKLLGSGVAIFDLDYVVILAAMYALFVSAEGDCYLCLPPHPGIEAAALGASESVLLGTAPAEALHNFTFDSGASRCFFRDSTTLTPLSAPVPVRLADPSGSPVVARSSTVLPCPTDAIVTTTTPGGQRVSICTCTQTGRHLATFTCRPGSSLYTLATKPPQVAASAQVSAFGQVATPLLMLPPVAPDSFVAHPPGSPLLATPPWHALPPPCLWFSQVSASPPALACPALPSLHRGAAARRSSLLLVSPDTYSPADSPHGRDLPVLHLHSIIGGEFSTDLLRNFCRGEGILRSFTLLDSPQQNGIAECRIGLVMEVARTSMIHAVAPYFLWPFAVQYAAHQLNLWLHVSLPETSPTLRWTGEVGDASVFWGPAPSCVSQVDPLPGTVPVEVAGDSGAARGAASRGATSGRAEPGGAEPGGAEPGGAESEGAGSWGAEPGGAEPRAGGSGGVAAAGSRGARTTGTGAAETGGVWGAGAGDPTKRGAAKSGGTGAGGPGTGGAGAGGPGVGGAGSGGTRAAGAGAVHPGAGGAGAGGTGARGTVRVRPYFVPLLQQVLGVPSSTGLTPPLLCPPPDQSQPLSQPASPLPAPSPYSEQTGGLTERREPASCLASPVRTGRRDPRPRPPPVPSTHAMALRPSFVPLRVPLPAPPESSLPAVESDLARATSPTISRLLATVVSDPSFESTAAFALVAELVDFAAACRLDYATALVVESASASPPSVGGECALGTDVLEDRQEDFECLSAAVPRFSSMLLAPERDPDAPDIPTSRSYAEVITGPYSSQWQSTGTYVDAVPPPRANIVDGIWIFRVMRPPGSPPAFKARYVARGFREQQGVDYFQTFSPTPNMTTLWPARGGLVAPPTWLHWVVSCRTTLAALGFTPSIADLSLFLRTVTLLPPFYILVYVDDLVFATADTEALTLVKSELQKRHTCTDLCELRSYLGLQITRDRARRTITLTQSHMVHQVLQRFGFQFSSAQPTPLSTGHSLSAPSSDESVEPSVRWAWGSCLEDGVQLSSLVTQRFWVDDSATQRSSQGYTFNLGCGSVSWRSTRSSSVLSSSCEAEIYARAMAAQELCWLTYLLTDLGEQPCLPPVLYVDNMAMIALCQEHRLEHRAKHIALRYFLARDLQLRGQLRLAYVATRANTADIFTKALSPGTFAWGFMGAQIRYTNKPFYPNGLVVGILSWYQSGLGFESRCMHM
ncbi:unnamed protein product [Closterium sp. NIES-54]